MIKDEELLEKAERGEGLTVEEVKRYQELVKPVHHVYGKYKRTGDYMTDVQRLTAMQQVIDEEIRNELVYV